MIRRIAFLLLLAMAVATGRAADLPEALKKARDLAAKNDFEGAAKILRTEAEHGDAAHAQYEHSPSQRGGIADIEVSKGFFVQHQHVKKCCVIRAALTPIKNKRDGKILKRTNGS